MYKRPADQEPGSSMYSASTNWPCGGESVKKKKRRSRWQNDDNDKTFIPGMPTVLPTNLSKDQERQYLLHLQIEEISRRLRTGDLGISPNPEDRSPSPEPIYNNEGKRLNTREYRTRKQLEEQRHSYILEAMQLNCDYKPPADYKPPIIRVNDKVMIPQEEHPDINFVGLLIGPRGNTLKKLEKETGAKIIIRGKGSVKEGKIGRKDGQPLPGEDEPLHAYVTANNPENVKKAVDMIKDIIRQGIEVPEGQNDLRREQLRELALLNGTLRENDGLTKLKQMQQAQTIITNTILCTVCGGTGHLGQDCKQKRPGDSFRAGGMGGASVLPPVDKAKMDSEYMSLMAELGEGPPPTSNKPEPRSFGHHHHHQHHGHNRFSGPPPLMGQPVPPPWHQQGGHSQPPPHHNGPPPPQQGKIPGLMNLGSQAPNNMSMPPPSSSVRPPVWSQPGNGSQPPPHSSYGSMMNAPPNSQVPPQTHPWQHPHHRNMGVPPPPVGGNMPPWQQQSFNQPPPPPSGSLPPWQQGTPGPVPAPVAPPPPPPSSLFSSSAPPPPPPGSFDQQRHLNTGIPSLLSSAPPPPPPPS